MKETQLRSVVSEMPFESASFLLELSLAPTLLPLLPAGLICEMEQSKGATTSTIASPVTLGGLIDWLAQLVGNACYETADSQTNHGKICQASLGVTWSDQPLQASDSRQVTEIMSAPGGTQKCIEPGSACLG